MARLKLFLVGIFFICFSAIVYGLSPTIMKDGRWDGINTFQVINARIDGRYEKVCLPKLDFKKAIDSDQFAQQLRDGLKSQNAIFHLYHDGTGKLLRKNGYLYASEIFLKDLRQSYTAYLRKQGYSFSVSNTKAYEEPGYIKSSVSVSRSSESIKKSEPVKKEVTKEEKKEKDQVANKPNLRVATVQDVLPKKILPIPIRADKMKVASIVANLKARPYKTEVIQIDPLRWASGYMGMLNDKGEIDMAKCEGQVVDMLIRVPDKAGWLTPEMLKEIQNTPCEYVLSRYKNGLEVVEGTRYLLHDIYFFKLKLSWSEWLEKHGLKCPEFVEKLEYANGVVPIELHVVEGILKQMDALSICQINFTQKSNLVFPQEIIRVFPPKPKPEKKQLRKFINEFNEKYKGKSIGVHLMVCPDGKSYTELGQKRAKRMRFNETSKLFADVEAEIIKTLND